MSWRPRRTPPSGILATSSAQKEGTQAPFSTSISTTLRMAGVIPPHKTTRGWQNCPGPGSWPGRVPVRLKRFPTVSPQTGLPSAVSHPLRHRPCLTAIHSRVGRYHPGNRPALPSDDDLLPLLHPIQQPTQFVLGLNAAISVKDHLHLA